jgi:hypothetical protein
LDRHISLHPGNQPVLRRIPPNKMVYISACQERFLLKRWCKSHLVGMNLSEKSGWEEFLPTSWCASWLGGIPTNKLVSQAEMYTILSGETPLDKLVCTP